MSAAEAKRLRRARALLAKKGGWTRGTFARSKTGRPVYEHARSAVSFCVSGACLRADVGTLLLRQAIGKRGGNLPDWNDDPDRTKREVLAAFSKAIKLAESGK